MGRLELSPGFQVGLSSVFYVWGFVKFVQLTSTRLLIALCLLGGGVVIALNATSGGVRGVTSLGLGAPSPPATGHLAGPVPDASRAITEVMDARAVNASPTAPAAASVPGSTGSTATAGGLGAQSVGAPTSSAGGATAGVGAANAAPSLPLPSLPVPVPSAPAPPAPHPAQPAASTARVHLRVGVADGSGAMFSSHWFRRLPIKIARYLVPWNAAVTRDKKQLSYARVWVAQAQGAGVEPMISFQAPGGKAGNHIPSVKEYTRAVKAFIHDLPQVKVYTPWNEPEFIYRSLTHNPGLAAAYFNTLVGACHRCTIVAGDFYLPANQGLGSWIRAYKRGLHHRPVAWAIHPYNDVRSHKTGQISTLERYVGHAQIWLDEISGVERRGHWPYPNQSPNAANNDERYLFKLPKRFHNITRIYHYQWQAVPRQGWDSGLLGPGGKPRPAYWTFANATRGKLP